MRNIVDYEMITITKIQQVIKTTVYSGLLFVMLMQSFLFDGWTHWAENVHFFVESNQLLQIAFFLSCLATLLEMFVSGPRALLAAIMIIIPRVFTITHQNFLLTEMVLLASLSNLNTKKQNMYIWMLVHVLYGVMLVRLNNTGTIAPIQTLPKPAFGLQTIGNSFGMGHPNSFALFAMSTVMMLWVMLKKHLRWWMTLILFLFTGAMIFYLTLSRTVVIIMVLFPIVDLVIETLHKKVRKGLETFILLIPFLLLAITLGVSLYTIYVTKDNMDSNFSMRFYELKAIIDNYHMPFGSFDVINGQGAYFDNLYLMLIACCGYIPTIIALASCGIMMRRLSKERNTSLLSVTAVFLLYGMMENAVIYSIYFFVPVLAFASQIMKNKESLHIANETEFNMTGGIEHG